MKNDPNANTKLAKAERSAQFRCGLIAPVLQGIYPDASAKAYFKRVAEKEFTLQGGTIQKYSWKAIEYPIYHKTIGILIGSVFSCVASAL